MTPPLLQGFPPIVDDDARVLILGSFPSALSLAAHQYYANPRNAFWPITSELFGFEPNASMRDGWQQCDPMASRSGMCCTNAAAPAVPTPRSIRGAWWSTTFRVVANFPTLARVYSTAPRQPNCIAG